MARGYVVNGPSASGTANKTAVSIVGGTGVRPRIFEFTQGISTAPNSTDQQLNWQVCRWTTSAGTAGSSPTPLAIDPGDVAATATAGITHSAEPTYASTCLMSQWMNQRSAFRWVAVPGYEYVNPATATTGIGSQMVSVTAASVLQSTVMFFE